jgi:ribonucleoside-diphosphate reductase beta chain
MSKLFRGTRAAYKPFDYPFCFEMFQMQNKLHWLPSEVSLQNDMVHWRSRLSAQEKHILEQVQLFLANADTDIAGVYCDKYLPNMFLPEVRSALLAIANIEAVHQESYAYTIDTLGMSENSYSAFLAIPEMMEKHEFITETRTEDLSPVQKFLLDIAVCSGFGEGLQLFSAFAIIMSFQRRGLMNGLCTLTNFIARDEDLHCEFMLKVFNTIKDENREEWTDDLIQYIKDSALRSVILEDHFIDLTFKLGDLENLDSGSVKQYIRYVCNKRLEQMGMSPLFNVKVNPMPWMDELLGGVEHTNFFENRSTSYSKSNHSGTWEEAWQSV